MTSTIKIASRSVSAILLLASILVIVGVIVDEDFKNKLVGYADDRISDWVTDQPVVTQLRSDLGTSQSELEASQLAAGRLEAENTELKRTLIELTSDFEKSASAVEQERSQLNSEFDRLKDELQQEVSSREIAIEQVRDKFTVIRVGDKILFDTGNSELKKRGQEVLGIIASTLKKFSDRQVRVEGHTDNIPIVSSRIKKRYPTNWELSSARATAAVRYLIENGGLDPKWVVAVGHAEYHPVSSNNTREGRSKNRRIEIILMPAEDSFKMQAIE